MCVGLQEYNGHSAHVTNCCFMFNDKHLITVGGADRCVFQWRHLEGDEDAADRERPAPPLPLSRSSPASTPTRAIAVGGGGPVVAATARRCPEDH